LATHERPDDEKRPLITYTSSPKFRESANDCIELLKNFPLKVWETQYVNTPKKKQTAWYVSFNGLVEKPWILNFTIQKSYARIEFRYPQFIPDYMLDKMEWQTNNWKYLSFSAENENEVKKYLEIYLKRIKNPFDQKELKEGGKSFAEGFVTQIIEDTFVGQPIKRNIRPEWLRSVRGKCLELDIFMPEMKLAIEIQGKQHFIDLYSNKDQHDRLKENDIDKKRMCKEKGIKLIWMDWDGVNKSLMRLPREKRMYTVKNLLDSLAKSSNNFIMWKNTAEITLE
jgi:hypothetical protein